MSKFKQFIKALLAWALAPVAAYAERNLVFYAYKGSTELSSVANPPRQVSQGIFGPRSTTVLPSSVYGQNLWLYNSTESSTDFITASFFTDGYYLGMKQGDLIMGAVTTGSSVSVYMGVIGAVTTAGCAIASTGGHLSSTR